MKTKIVLYVETLSPSTVEDIARDIRDTKYVEKHLPRARKNYERLDAELRSHMGYGLPTFSQPE